MKRADLIKLATACATVSLFQEHYVKVSRESLVFTVAVYDGQSETKEPVFMRSLDMLSGKSPITVRTGSDATVVEALLLTFNETHLRAEALEALEDYLSGGSGSLDSNEYGQMTFASDLEELRVGDDEWVIAGTNRYIMGEDEFTLGSNAQ
jgi:hypothetical protein